MRLVVIVYSKKAQVINNDNNYSIRSNSINELLEKIILVNTCYFLLQGVGGEVNSSCHRHMVVFQYGSAVLFNVGDHEVDSYLEIVRKHASGILQETRKDGQLP